MNKRPKINIDYTDNQAIGKAISESLKKFNESIIGPYEPKPFTIYALNEDQTVIAGIRGDIIGDLCRVFTVWVHEDYRHQGLGTELFSFVDSHANSNKCKHIQLDTAEFQAKEFYEKLGYSIAAILESNFMGYTSYIMRKRLP